MARSPLPWRNRNATMVGVQSPPRVAPEVGRFVLGSLAAIAVIAIGGYFALRSVAIDEAERDTRERVQIEGRLVATALTEDVIKGDPAALARFDDLVQTQILGESVVRVKLWSRDGRILYSDEPALIGQRFELGEEEQELFDTGGADAELSDLSEPENRYERQEGKLLEAHTPIRTPGRRHAGPVRDLPALRVGVGVRVAARAGVRAAADRRPDRPAALPGAVGVVARQAPAARPRGARAAAGGRDRGLRPGAPPDRRRPARRRRPGPRGRRLRPRAAGRRRAPARRATRRRGC